MQRVINIFFFFQTIYLFLLIFSLQIMKKGTIQKHGSIAKLKQEKNGYSIKLKLQVRTDSPSTETQGDPETLGHDEVDGVSEDIATVDGLTSYLKEMNYEVKDSHLVSVCFKLF